MTHSGSVVVINTYRTVWVFCGVIGHDPVVWSLVILTRTVSDGRPEERVSLWGRPHPFVNLIGDHCVFREPLHHVRCFYRWFPLQPDWRFPEVVTHLMPCDTLKHIHKSLFRRHNLMLWITTKLLMMTVKIFFIIIYICLTSPPKRL